MEQDEEGKDIDNQPQTPYIVEGKWYYNLGIWIIRNVDEIWQGKAGNGINQGHAPCLDKPIQRSLTQENLDRFNDIYKEDFETFGFDVEIHGLEYWEGVMDSDHHEL